MTTLFSRVIDDPDNGGGTEPHTCPATYIPVPPTVTPTTTDIPAATETLYAFEESAPASEATESND